MEVEDGSWGGDFDVVGFIVDGALVLDDIDCSEALTKVEEGLLHCVGDGLRLVLHCEIEVLGVVPELVEDDDRVFGAELGLLLEFLHAGDDLPCEPAGLEGLVLSGVEKDAELVGNYMMRSPPMASYSATLSFTNFS